MLYIFHQYDNRTNQLAVTKHGYDTICCEREDIMIPHSIKMSDPFINLCNLVLTYQWTTRYLWKVCHDITFMNSCPFHTAPVKYSEVTVLDFWPLSNITFPSLLQRHLETSLTYLTTSFLKHGLYRTVKRNVRQNNKILYSLHFLKSFKISILSAACQDYKKFR